MIEKIRLIASSIRFWQLVIASMVVILGQYEILPADVAQTIAGLLGVSVTIGTIDKVSKK